MDKLDKFGTKAKMSFCHPCKNVLGDPEDFKKGGTASAAPG
jgi:hypothetical protein